MERLDDLEDVATEAESMRTAMLTLDEGGGALTSRPMTLQQFDAPSRQMWFIVDRTADWVDTEDAPPVNVAFVDSGDTWISISGRAAYLREQGKLDELWDTITDAWYPEAGAQSADAWLLRVDVDQVEWWANPSTLKFMYEVAKAQITDERPEEGASGTIDA